MEYTIKISDNNIEAEALVDYLKTLDFVKIVKSEPVDWYDELTDAQKTSIQKGEEDLKAGRVHSHEDVMKRMDELIETYK